MPFFKFTTTSILVLLLSACSIDSYNINDNSTNDSISGKWHDKAGMISDFDNGHFETYTPDTNEKLSEGSYNIDENNPAIVDIELKSLVRGTISQVKCNLNKTKLYCVAQPKADSMEEPNPFQLSRVN